MNFDLLDLQAFLSVLDEGSFVKAAEVLNLSQPALSRRIKNLEDSIGTPLLERTTRRVSATAEGRRLQPVLARIIDELESSMLSMSKMGDRQSGTIAIASVPTAAFYFLPRVIKQFNAQHPHIRFRIHGLAGSEGLKSVADGQTEFGINTLGAGDPDLRFTHLMDDPFVLACPRDHVLAKKDTVQWKDLAGFPLIGVSRQSTHRTILDSALAKTEIEFDWFYEVNHLSTSLGLVEAGLGVSILPKLATPQSEHPLIVIRPLTDPIVRRPIGIIERRSGRLSPIAARFRQMLIESWSDDLGERME
ncbi:MAG TPA: LysR family transcriptional regulator [Devosiaceae bacterium]